MVSFTQLALLLSVLLLDRYASAMEIHMPNWRLAQRHPTPRVNTSISVETLKDFSRSQSKEDIRLFENYFCGITNGTFIELGALDGTLLSNSYMFEFGLGWRGTLIEANPRSFAGLKVNRPGSVCIHAAVCDSYRTVRYVIKGGPQVTGILDFMTDSFKEKWHPLWRQYSQEEAPSVACYPLESLLRVAGIAHYQFMSLDVEGAELLVLQSMNFATISVNVLVIEATGREPEREAAVRQYVQDVGYRYVESWGRSDWFVRNGWEPLPCPKKTVM